MSAQSTVRFCPYCGAPVKPGDTACSKCCRWLPGCSPEERAAAAKTAPQTKAAPSPSCSKTPSLPPMPAPRKRGCGTTFFIILLLLAAGAAAAYFFIPCFYGHQWQPASCTEPETCAVCAETIGKPLGHDAAAADCTEAGVCRVCGQIVEEALGHDRTAADCVTAETCKRCGQVWGEPLGHIWLAADCRSPETCERCGETRGSRTDHSWSPAGEDSPSICAVCGQMKPLPLPESGTVFIGKNKGRGSSVTINSSGSECCYVKLKDEDKNDVFSFFVRAGDNVTVSVPVGHFYIYFAHGSDWYGSERLFGPETSYSMDDELNDLYSYTISYTLYPTANGNFSQTPIPEEAF